MTAIYHSPFLMALGWTIAESLWQAALLWLIYQLVSNIDKKNSPAFKHGVAALFLFTSFIWFGITLVQHYTEIVGLTQSLTKMAESNASATQAMLTITNAGFPRTQFMDMVNVYLPYFSAAYLIVLCVLLVKLFNAYVFSRQLRTKGLLEVESYWENFVNRYAKNIGITRSVKIYFSELIDVPATLDFIKPVILLPVAAFNHLTPQQVESVLLHELAHIKRNDYLVNIIASVIETLLFFNPFVHLLGKSLKKEREHCCDDMVLHHKFDPHSYASALLSLEKMRAGFQPLAVAATGNSNQLLGRVKRIMNVKSNNFNYGQKLLALAVTALILISIAWLSPGSPQDSTTLQSKTFKTLQQTTIDSTGSRAIISYTKTTVQPTITKSSDTATAKKITQDESKLKMANEIKNDVDKLLSPIDANLPLLHPVPAVPLPPTPPQVIQNDFYAPAELTLQTPFYAEVFDHTHSADAFSDEEEISFVERPEKIVKEKASTEAYERSLKSLERVMKDIDPSATKNIIRLFLETQSNTLVHQQKFEALLDENFKKLQAAAQQKKMLLDRQLFIKKDWDKKTKRDSIQNSNRQYLRKGENQKAIWINHTERNNNHPVENIYASSINANSTVQPAYMRAANNIDKNTPGATTINAYFKKGTATRKNSGDQTEFTLAYPSTTISDGAAISREVRVVKKIIITDEAHNKTLVITIE